MSKRIWLNVILLPAILAGPLWAQSLVPIDAATVTDGHVYLMENVGVDVPDDSANNNNGTFVGSPQVVPGLNGSALQFNGTSDAVVLPNVATINLSTHQNKTYIAVFKCADVSKSEKQCVFEEGGSTRGANIYVHQGLVYAGGWNAGDYTPQWAGTFLSAPIGSDEWHVVAAVLRDGTAGQTDDKFEMWLDGKLIGKGPGGELRSRSNANGIGYTTQTKYHDGNVNAAGGYFDGIVDEIWILNQALPEDVLGAITIGPGKAKNPVPADGVVDLPRDGILSWDAGKFAQTHDVYLGTAFVDVNTASRADPKGVLAGRGEADTTFGPSGSLAYGQTYYWRVDEVNGPPDNTIFKGEVWSFTVEPYGYPITNVTATASSYQPGMEPEKTIDGSGLTGDLHDTVETSMWLSAGVQPNWIQYEFDKVYQLYNLQVWNSNQVIEPFLGFGAKTVTIETSTDGVTWTPVPDVSEFAQGPGTDNYAANTTVPLGGVMAKYVKLTITANWGGLTPQAGLSEVRFTYAPMRAYGPQPADAATGVRLDTSLDWRPGREAGSHQIYLGTDANAVAVGTVPTGTVTDHSYVPDALNLWTTYYWRVDEANTVTYAGDVWSFTTQEYQVVDDFESYTDQPGEEIFSTWIDGFADQSSGSTVGLLTATNGTFGETTIVHGDKQSMPLAYDNTAAPQYSEAKLTFSTPQDWTAHGIKSLSLWFQGVAGNGGQLYVKINSTKIAYDGDAADLAWAAWQVWNIDLSQAGNVRSVRTLTIGVEGAGAQGTLYIDDIRLYPKAPEYITPVQPADTDLLVWWPLNEGTGTVAVDHSGNGYDGAFTSAPQWVAGYDGTALNFDDVDDSVIYRFPDETWSAYTLTVWAKADVLGQANNSSICSTYGSTAGGFQLSFDAADHYQYHAGVDQIFGPASLDWVHLAVTYDGTAATAYYKGVPVAIFTPAPSDLLANKYAIGVNRAEDNWFDGTIDDFRVYNRTLTAAEVAGLAGRTSPVAKPF